MKTTQQPVPVSSPFQLKQRKMLPEKTAIVFSEPRSATLQRLLCPCGTSVRRQSLRPAGQGTAGCALVTALSMAWPAAVAQLRVRRQDASRTPRWFLSGPDCGAPASICVLHSRSALQLPQEALWARSSGTDFVVTVRDPGLSHDPRRCLHSCLCELLPPLLPILSAPGLIR